MSIVWDNEFSGFTQERRFFAYCIGPNRSNSSSVPNSFLRPLLSQKGGTSVEGFYIDIYNPRDFPVFCTYFLLDLAPGVINGIQVQPPMIYDT